MQISETEHLEFMDQLRYFLATGPSNWSRGKTIQKLPLPNGECISCIYWNNLFFITGTDIVRCLAYRFEAFGRPVSNMKKFEEGVFSDLRNLKPGLDAILEPPRSEFLEMLFRNNCIRTQKKQKVFFWYSVPHDRLFIDALERDLKRDMKKISNIADSSNLADSLDKKAGSKIKPKLYPSPTQSLIPQRADLFMVGDVASLSSGATTTSNHNKPGSNFPTEIKARGAVSPGKHSILQGGNAQNSSSMNSSMHEHVSGANSSFSSNAQMPYTTPRLVSSPPKEISELPSADGMWDSNRSMNLAYGPGGHGRYMTHDGTYHSDTLPSWAQSSPYPHAVNCPSPGKFEASPYFTPQLGNTPIQDQGAVFIGEGAASALGYPFLSSSSTPVVDPSATFEQGSMGDHYLPPLMGFGMDGHSMGAYDQKPGQLNSVPEYSMLPPMKSSADENAHDNKSIAGIPSRHYNHPYHMNSLPARVDAAEKSYLSHQTRHNSLPYSRPSEYENSHSLAEDSFCLSWDALNDSMPSQWNDKSNRKTMTASAKRNVRSSTMTHDTHGQNHLSRSAQTNTLGLTSARYQNDDNFDKREKIEGDVQNRLPSILKRRTSDFNSALLDGFM